MKKLVLLAAAAVVLGGCSLTSLSSLGGTKVQAIGLEAAKTKAVDFINTNLMQQGATVSVKEAVEEGDLYKIVVNSNGQDIPTYLTKDGKTFFPQAMNIAEVEAQKAATPAADDTQAQATPNVPKAKKANVELFVMSHCPYGTQIEKGIIPAVKALGDEVDFTVKFCDYAMHGEPELKEQMNQYCIQKNQPDKLLTYLDCFLKAGDSASCLKPSGINEAKLKTCVAATDKEYKVMAGFNDQTTWVNGRFPQFNVFKADNTKYAVKGSPALVINGTTASTGRDSASLLKAICAGYENPPAACTTELSSASPAPGFGAGTTNSTTDAGCGS